MRAGWGCGPVYAKRAPHPGQPLLASGMEMICAGMSLCLTGAASGEFGRISGASLVSGSGLALGYLIVPGSLPGYSTHEWLLHHASSQLAGTYAFASPLVAVILGWWLLGEKVSGHALLPSPSASPIQHVAVEFPFSLPQSLASSSVAVRPACAVRRRKSASSWSSASPYSAQIWSIEVFIPE